MKKILTLIPLLVAFLAILPLGCGVEKVDPPVPIVSGGTTGSPTNVVVALSPTAILNGGNALVTATVTDSSARVMSNVSVSFSVISAAAGSFNPASAVTNGSGQATSTFTAASPAGDNQTATIRAMVTTSTGTISGTAQITIGSPPRIPTSITVQLGSSSIDNPGGLADNTTVTATVRDASGVIPGATVTFTSSVALAGDFTPAGPWTTDALGQVQVTFTATMSDTLTDISAASGSVSNSASLTIGTPVGPAPTSMSLSITPLSISISSQATVTVTLMSGSSPSYNQPVILEILTPTAGGDESFSPTDPAFDIINAPPLMTNASGVVSATFYSRTSSGSVLIRATSGTLSQTASLTITSDPASVTINVVDSSLVNGQTTNITATVRNIMGSVVPDGIAVTFSSSNSSVGTLSSTTAYTSGGNGTAQVTFTANSSLTGTTTITASAGTAPSAIAQITVSAAQAGSLEFVSATPDIIGIAGSGTTDSSEVKFLVKNVNGAPQESVAVNFTLYGPTGATLDTGGTTSSGSTDINGEVITRLHAGPVAGPARVVATVTLGSSSLNASSGNISIGGGVPSDRWFSIAVSRFNLDGLGCNGVESTISAYIADRFGNYNILQGTSVSFATDAGAIDTSNITDANGYTTAVYRTQDPRPTDVAPDAWEPSYVDGTGRTRNPRDGWVTVLVSTTGEEHFVDQNADGVYTLAVDGANFTDIPEPFVDSDDNGTRDAGELFFDWPGGVTGVPGATAGVYNDVNSVWDARIPIFRNVNLVFTGPPVFGPNTTRIVDSLGGTGAVTIPAGGAATLYLYLSDINLNTPIGGTNITASSSKTEAKVEITSGYDTIPDGLSYGPSVIGITVTNNNTTGTPMVAPISATIEWPGKCGTITTKISYPGTVTLQ